jgi:RNA polymerase sigma factor (sigma-70 family)
MTTDLNRHIARGLTEDRIRKATERRAARALKRRARTDAADLERLVAAAASGDHAAWSALTQRFGARVRAVARNHRLSAADAEDVVQTTWMRLLEHIDRIREPRAVGVWLETAAARESLRVLRSGQRERPTDDEATMERPVAPVDIDELASAERRAALAAAVDGLGGSQQRLVTLLFSDPEPSYKTVSDTLGVPIGSIGPTRARALARLRADERLARVVRLEV